MNGSELDLLLINVGGIRKKLFQDLSKDYSAIETPFWVALNAGFFRKKGYSVNILDANAENLGVNEAAEKAVSMKPKFIDIVVYGQHPSASTQLMDGVNALCREIKKLNKELKIILTGPHPSALPKKTLKEAKCDFVAEGEGFYTVLGLLEGKNLAKVPGLWYEEQGNILSNPRAPLIKDLTSELDEVAWDLLPMDKYKSHNWQALEDLDSRNKYASIYTSLGCPFNCNFCCINAPFGGPGIRYWSPEWVLKQIDILVKKYGIKYLKIIDELFVLNPDHFMPIAEGLIERNYNLNIWAYARVDTIRAEYLKKLRVGGLKWVCLGIESGNKDIRKASRKGAFTETDIREVVKKIKDADIKIIGNYMFGLPEDDLKSMQETLDLAIELNCEYANFYSVMAYPGSELYNNAVKQGLKLPDSWIGFSQHSYEILPLPTKKISAAEVLKFRDSAFDIYFTNLKYLNMIEEKFGKKAREHIENMTKIKLKRKLFGD